MKHRLLLAKIVSSVCNAIILGYLIYRNVAWYNEVKEAPDVIRPYLFHVATGIQAITAISSTVLFWFNQWWFALIAGVSFLFGLIPYGIFLHNYKVPIQYALFWINAVVSSLIPGLNVIELMINA